MESLRAQALSGGNLRASMLRQTALDIGNPYSD